MVHLLGRNVVLVLGGLVVHLLGKDMVLPGGASANGVLVLRGLTIRSLWTSAVEGSLEFRNVYDLCTSCHI